MSGFIKFACAGVVLALLCGARPAAGDELSLRSGEKINGVLLGADARYIKFLDAAGTPRSFLHSDVAGIELGSGPPQSLADRFESESQARTIPAGTVLTVRTIDRIDSREASPGAKFQASIDEPVLLKGDVVIPKGSPAALEVMTVQHAGALKGEEVLSLQLREVRVADRTRSVGSSFARMESAGKGRKTLVKTVAVGGAGALIGAIAGGGVGALVGGGIGGAAGLAISAASNSRVKVDPETRLLFTLRRPVVLEDVPAPAGTNADRTDDGKRGTP